MVYYVFQGLGPEVQHIQNSYIPSNLNIFKYIFHWINCLDKLIRDIIHQCVVYNTFLIVIQKL